WTTPSTRKRCGRCISRRWGGSSPRPAESPRPRGLKEFEADFPQRPRAEGDAAPEPRQVSRVADPPPAQVVGRGADRVVGDLVEPDLRRVVTVRAEMLVARERDGDVQVLPPPPGQGERLVRVVAGRR